MGSTNIKKRKIKEYILNILKSEQYSEEEIKIVFQLFEQLTIEETKLFTPRINKIASENGIIDAKDFLNLTILEAATILNLTRETIRNKIKAISLRLITTIEKHRNEITIESMIEETHNKLTQLINEIKQNELLNNYLKEDILELQTTKKKWKHTRLELTEKELTTLRSYIKNTINIETNNQSKQYQLYNIISSIYEKLSYYIIKLQYKKIVDQNYYELETIDLTPAEQNSLRRNNILCVSDILEYTEKELLELPLLGNQTQERILKNLEDRNIYLLCKKQQVIESLKHKNANIKTKTK